MYYSESAACKDRTDNIRADLRISSTRTEMALYNANSLLQLNHAPRQGVQNLAVNSRLSSCSVFVCSRESIAIAQGDRAELAHDLGSDLALASSEHQTARKVCTVPLSTVAEVFLQTFQPAQPVLAIDLQV